MTASNALLRNVHFLLSILLIAFPLFPLKVASATIVVWGIVSLLVGFGTTRESMRSKRNYFILFASIFILLLISIAYTPDPDSGWFLIERSLGLIVFPLSFFLYPGMFSARQAEILFKAYILANVLVVVKVYGFFIFYGFEFLTGVFSHDFRVQFELYSGMHPTYASMVLLFAVIVKLHYLSARWHSATRTQKVIDFLIILLLFANTLLLASRTPLAAFVVVMILFAIHRMKNTKWVLPVTVISVVLFLTSIQFFPSISNRVSELSLQNLKPPVGDNHNSVNIRAGVAICSVELLKENWLFGLGAGSVQTALNDCYEQFDTDIYRNKDYNTHNQFFNFWLNAGLLAVVAFLLMLLVPMIQAYSDKQHLYFLFLVFFAICCLTENLLSRQVGVEFYALFNSLLAFNRLRIAPPEPDAV